jgi:hypothetical protein
MHVLRGAAAGLIVSVSGACGGPAGHDAVTLEFRPDVAVGEEAYVCFGFEAGPVRDRGISGIDWDRPTGAVVLHHAKLYATPTAYPTGPIACDQQPTGAVPLHTWLPGGGSLAMPSGVALALPDNASSLVVEAHVFRSATGDAPLDRARIALANADAAVHAGWTARSGIVPALRPDHIETSTDQCALTSAFHIYFAWPHMHLLGRTFQAIVATGTGQATLLDVPTWNFASEEPAVLDLDLAPGDLLTMTCSWNNTTDQYVLPGPKTTDEMCGLGLIVSPPLGAQLPCAVN